MSTKRKVSTSFISDRGDTKRYRQSLQETNDEDGLEDVRPGYQATSAKLDPESGQRGAFPGLDDDYDEEQLFYGPASDGLEYLRMVRSEAKAVPKLLVATSLAMGQEKYDSVYRRVNGGGCYADGAYTAETEHSVEYGLDEPDAQEVYYRALVARFTKLRHALSNGPPSISKSSVAPEVTINLDVFQKTSHRAQWDYCFRQTLPTARCLAMASQEDIIRAVSRLEALLTKRNLLDQAVGRNISAWLWSLLARCREVGQMGSDHISVLRGLAKTAITVGYKTKHGSKDVELVFDTSSFGEMGGNEANKSPIIETERYSTPYSIGAECIVTEQFGQLSATGAEAVDNQSGGFDDSGGFKETEPAETGAEQLEKSRRALLGRLSRMNEKGSSKSFELTNDQQSLEESVERALAVVDIVVTLVGEVFGQRDLLNSRDIW